MTIGESSRLKIETIGSRHGAALVVMFGYRLALTVLASLFIFAAAVHLDVSTVSRHVAQVERTGLVARTPDPADGRAQLVGITTEGQQLLDQAFQRRRDLLESTLSGWEPDDIAEFERLLGKFVSGVNSQTSKDPA